MNQTAVYIYFLTFGSLLGVLFFFLTGVCLYWWKKYRKMTSHFACLSLPPVLLSSAGFFYFFFVAGSEFDGWWHTAVGRDGFFILPHIAMIAGSLCLTAITLLLLTRGKLNGTRNTFFLKSSLLFQIGFYAGLVLDNTAHNLFGQENISTSLVLFAPPHLFGGLCFLIAGFFLIALLNASFYKEPERSFLVILTGGSMIGLVLYQYQGFWPLGIYHVSGVFGQYIMMTIVGIVFSLLWRKEKRFLFAGFALSIMTALLEAIRMSGGGIDPSVPYPFVPFRVPSLFLFFSFLASGMAIDIFRICKPVLSERRLAIAGCIYGFTQSLFYYVPAQWWISYRYPHILFFPSDLYFLIAFGSLGGISGFLLPVWGKSFFLFFYDGLLHIRAYVQEHNIYFYHTLFTKKKLLFFTCACALLAGVGFLLFFLFIQKVKKESCAQKTNKEIYSCYRDTIGGIMKEQGTAPALQYAKDVVIKKTNYNMAHLIMHVIGRGAYEEAHDIARALTYLPQEAGANPYYYDGYRHGLFQAYFQEHRDQRILPLIKSVCSEEDVQSQISLSSAGKGKGEIENCFHGVGHAIMYAHTNDVAQSLNDCGELLGATPRYWCFYGVFMEYSYGFSPLYDVEKTIEISDTSMIPLCSRVNNEQRAVCMQFVGRAFLTKHQGDIKGAFHQCELLEETYRSSCIAQASRIFIPSLFKDDIRKMADACKEASVAYRESCIKGVASGIKQGIAGFDSTIKKTAFCHLVKDWHHKGCVNN